MAAAQGSQPAAGPSGDRCFAFHSALGCRVRLLALPLLLPRPRLQQRGRLATAVSAASCAAALLSCPGLHRHRSQPLRNSSGLDGAACLSVKSAAAQSTRSLMASTSWLDADKCTNSQARQLQQPHPKVHVRVEDLRLEAHGRRYQRILLRHIDRQLKGATLKRSFRRALHTSNTHCFCWYAVWSFARVPCKSCRGTACLIVLRWCEHNACSLSMCIVLS